MGLAAVLKILMKYDGLVTYSTTKRVKIRDPRLAASYFIVVAGGVLYIVVYSILYKNMLFMQYDVSGEADLTIQQPTYHGCNPRHDDCKNDFRPLTELPYCRLHAAAHADDKKKLPCKFEEPHRFNPAVVPGALFVPTRMDHFTMSGGCNPTKSNGWTCQESWLMFNRTTTLLADIERYTLKLSHSWSIFTGGVIDSGTQSRSAGFVLTCENVDKELMLPVEVQRKCPTRLTTKPIECLVGDCNGPLPDPFPIYPGEDTGARIGRIVKGGIFAISSGDIFRLDALLALAGLDLDETLNEDNETLREAGTVLMVDAVYSNLRPWWSLWEALRGTREYTYTYHVQQVPATEYKQERMSRKDNIVADEHGILILINVRGLYGMLCFSRLMIALTSLLGIVALARAIADHLAMCSSTVPNHAVHNKHHMFDEVNVHDWMTEESAKMSDDLGNETTDAAAKTPLVENERMDTK